MHDDPIFNPELRSRFKMVNKDILAALDKMSLEDLQELQTVIEDAIVEAEDVEDEDVEEETEEVNNDDDEDEEEDSEVLDDEDDDI